MLKPLISSRALCLRNLFSLTICDLALILESFSPSPRHLWPITVICDLTIHLSPFHHCRHWTAPRVGLCHCRVFEHSLESDINDWSCGYRKGLRLCRHWGTSLQPVCVSIHSQSSILGMFVSLCFERMVVHENVVSFEKTVALFTWLHRMITVEGFHNPILLFYFFFAMINHSSNHSLYQYLFVCQIVFFLKFAIFFT